MKPLKPALTYQDQLTRLQTVHGLAVANPNSAIEILKKVNYYRLSAYGIGLKRKDDAEKYKTGISLEHLYRLYQFDCSLRNLVAHMIEPIEVQLRTQISNLIGLKYGPEGYIDPANFVSKTTKDGKLVHDIVIENFKNEVDHQQNTPFVQHHVTQYGGHFPVWVATELFTFGNLSSLYSIMRYDDRKTIAQLYNASPGYLESWILTLVEVRNICAHYGRLYNMPLKQTPQLYMPYKRYQSSHLNKLFPVLLCIKRMLDSDERWMTFEERLETLVEEYQDVVRISYMGFPKDWESALR